MTIFYRIKWTTTVPKMPEKGFEVCTETCVREYLASAIDAWELWYWLTTRSTMDPEYHAKMVAERRESAIFASSYVPPTTTVNVYALDGTEVAPDQGLRGMFRPKEKK